MMGGISFLVQCIWSSVGFLYVHGHLFLMFGKFSSIILLKIFAGPLSWTSSFSSSPIICRFGLLTVSWISWMFWFRIILRFLWLLCPCFVWNLLHLRVSLPSLAFCCCYSNLWFQISFLGFISPGLSHFGFSLLFLLPVLGLGWFCSIPSPVWLCFPAIL